MRGTGGTTTYFVRRVQYWHRHWHRTLLGPLLAQRPTHLSGLRRGYAHDTTSGALHQNGHSISPKHLPWRVRVQYVLVE